MIKDGDWTLMDWDPVTGRTIWSYFDGQATHYRTDTPVADVLEANKAAASQSSSGWSGDWHRVASVPMALLYGDGYLGDASRANDMNAMTKWLNDSDNRAWRVKGGNL